MTIVPSAELDYAVENALWVADAAYGGLVAVTPDSGRAASKFLRSKRLQFKLKPPAGEDKHYRGLHRSLIGRDINDREATQKRRKQRNIVHRVHLRHIFGQISHGQ